MAAHWRRRAPSRGTTTGAAACASVYAVTRSSAARVCALSVQTIAVEHAPGLVPGDRHCFVRRDAGVDEVGDGGVPGVVKDVAATLATDGKPAFVHAVAQSRLKSPTHP